MGTSEHYRRFGLSRDIESDPNYLSELDEPIGSVTSRDQIIDPYALVDSNNYNRTGRGKMSYQADLERAKAYAEKQEAAYQEWYNSPEQIALRERQAGRNPDLIDGALGSGEAADTQPSSSSPMEGVPSVGDDFANYSQGISSFASTIGGLMAVPSQIMSTVASAKLAKSQNNLVFMQGLREFEGLVFNDVSSRVAQGYLDNPNFNLTEFLSGDFEEVFSAYAPSDSPQYRAAFQRALGNVQRLSSDAYQLGASTTQNKSWFARELAHPYNDPDFVTMIAQWEPVEEARQQIDTIELDMRKLFAEIKTRYASELDPEELASYFMESQEFQALHQKCLALCQSARYQVQANLLEQYLASKDKWYGKMSALNCMSLLLGHGPLTWQNELTNYVSQIVANLFPTSNSNSDISHPDVSANVVQPAEPSLYQSSHESIIGKPSIPGAFRSGMDYHEGVRYYDVRGRRGNRIKFGD